MNIKLLKAIVVGLVLSVSGFANAGLITEDFNTGPYVKTSGNVVTAPNITFSHNLFEHNDGFQLNNGFAVNWYGENNEYFIFDDSYYLDTIDFWRRNTSPYEASNLNVYLYNDLNDLIKLVNFDISTTKTTFNFNTFGVKKVQIQWTDTGIDVYGDGRKHQWYAMDNIVYDTEKVEVPEPSTLAIFALGIMGLASRRFKKQ